MNNIVVIGMGKMGLLHASLLSTIPDVTVTAFCEKNGMIRRYAKNILPGIPVVDSVEKLAGSGIDAAYITTPPSSHFPIVDTLITDGICRNIFVEKPLANNAQESRKIEDILKKSPENHITMVGYNRRFNVVLRKARDMVLEGTIGNPVSFKAYGYSSDYFGKAGGEKGSRGGVVKDLGCHAIDLAIWFMGDLTVKSMISSELSDYGTPDSVSFDVMTGNNVKGQIGISWIEPGYRLPEIGIIVEGDNGTVLSASEEKLELRSTAGTCETWYKQDLHDNVSYFLGGTDYLREDEAFVSAIERGVSVEPSFTTALKVDEIIDELGRYIHGNE